MRPYQPNIEWAWEIPITTRGLALVIADELDQVIQTLSDFVQARGQAGFLGGKHTIHYTETTIRVVARWRMIRPDPHWGALKLQAIDARFHYLDTHFLAKPFQECLACEAAEPEPAPGGVEPRSEDPEVPADPPAEPESPREPVGPEMPAAEPAKSFEDLPTAAEVASPVPETPPAEPEAPAEPETPDPGPEGPAGDDLDGLETVGPAEPDQADHEADHAEAPAPKPKRKYKKRKKAKRKTAKRKTN